MRQGTAPVMGATDDQANAIIEEKIVKVSGETLVKKYLKGKFLGKVSG